MKKLVFQNKKANHLVSEKTKLWFGPFFNDHNMFHYDHCLILSITS